MVRAVAVSALYLLFVPIAVQAATVDGDHSMPVEILADGGAVRIAAVEDDGSLRAEDGRIVRLASIHIPNESKWRRAAVATLRSHAAGRDARLYVDVRIRDRYGHVLAQVVTDDGEWLQSKLIAGGLAEVEVRAGETTPVKTLLALEAAARKRGVGLWSDPNFAVVSAEDIAANPSGHLNRSGIVEGTVVSVSNRANWTFVNFGPDWHTDFTIAIAARDRRAVSESGLDLASLAGKHIRVRGWIRDWNGPLIEVDTAEQVEIFADPLTIADTSRP